MSRNKHDKPKIAGGRVISLYAVLAGLTVAVVIALAWYVLDARERSIITGATESTIRGVETLIKLDIEARVVSLSGLARQLGGETSISRDDWENLARIIYLGRPGYQSIGWIDSSQHVRWVLPLEGNEIARGFDLRFNPPALAAAITARERNRVAFTTPLDSIHGGKGLGIYVPVNRSGPDGEQFAGLVGSVLLIEPLLQVILPTEVMTEHSVAISINGKSLFSTDPIPTAVDQQWVQQRQFELYGVNWQLQVAPREEFLLGTYFRFSNAMLVLLILLTSLTSLAVYYLLISRARTKQALATARRLDSLFSNLPGMSYRCEEYYPWAMVFVSDGCQALCGYERRVLENKQVLWGELIHPADLETVQQAVAEAVAERRHFDVEYRIYNRGGALRWVWDRGLAIASDSGGGAILEGFLSDITDRRRAELSLIQEKAYSESIVAAAIDAVITVGASGKVETFNPAAQTKFGYTKQEMEGRDFSQLIPEPYKKEYGDLVADYQQTGELPARFERREVSGKHRDGSEFPVQLSVSKMQHQTERKLVCLVRDISTRVAAEQEVRDLREKLAHVDRLTMLGEMATGIAHEINQPLTAISLFSQAGKRLLVAGKKDRLSDILDKLSEHALRAGAIVERMQMMTEQHVSSFETVVCNTLVEEVIALAQADGRIRGIVIDFELADGLPLVSVDRVQIQQVVLNLLRNGMQAMQTVNCERGDSISLQTRLNQRNEIEVSVRDSGGGVSKEAAGKIFTPFSTTRESGMGIGLSISRAIILAHGGEINFYNNDGGGATFYFTLPAVVAGEQDG